MKSTLFVLIFFLFVLKRYYSADKYKTAIILFLIRQISRKIVDNFTVTMNPASCKLTTEGLLCNPWAAPFQSATAATMNQFLCATMEG